MKTTIRVLGSVALLIVVACRLEWHKLGATLASFDLGYGVTALAVFVAAQMASSCRWLLTARTLGFIEPYYRFIGLYFVGMFFNLCLPSSIGGDAVKAWFLAGNKARLPAALLSVFAERLGGLMILLLLAVGAVFFVEMPAWVVYYGVIPAGLILVGLVVAMALASLGSLPKRLLILRDVVHAFAARPGIIAGVLGLSVFVQLSGIFQMWLILRGLDVEVPLGWLALTVPLLSLLTLIPISINGMGLRELGTELLLAPVGITGAVAVSSSLLLFLVNTVASLAGGLCRFREPDHAQEADVVSGDSHQGRGGQSAAAA
jgi:hypothetical protein